jgi:hypothetical protein
MKGFKLIAKTAKGEKGIKEAMKANLQKKVLLNDPFTVEFLFDRSHFVMRRTVKESDLNFFLERMFAPIIGKRGLDYDVEIIKE